MNLIIGILLYIGVVVPDSTYSTAQIEDFQQEHATEISVVHGDPVQLQQAEQLYIEFHTRVLVFEELLL